MSPCFITRRLRLTCYGVNYVHLFNLKSPRSRQTKLRFISCSQIVFNDNSNDAKCKNTKLDKEKNKVFTNESVIKGKYN